MLLGEVDQVAEVGHGASAGEQPEGERAEGELAAGGWPGGERPERAAITHVPWVFVDDLDSHFARAQAGGASIVDGVHHNGYRAYVADDLEGNRWTFAQARPSMR